MSLLDLPKKEKPNTTRIIELKPNQEIRIGNHIYKILRKLRNDRIIVKFLREMNYMEDIRIPEILNIKIGQED